MDAQEVGEKNEHSSRIQKMAPHSKKLEWTVAVTAAISAVISLISLEAAFSALDRADQALNFQAYESRDSNLNRIEEIYVEQVAPIQSDGSPQDEILRLRRLVESIGLVLDRINAASPVFYDKYLTQYPDIVNKVRIKITERLLFGTYLDTNGKVTTEIEENISIDKEINDFVEGFQSHLFNSIRKERMQFSKEIYKDS